jgi:hypothetical protein
MVNNFDYSRKIFGLILAARFGRPQPAVSSGDVHSSSQWLPTAEEYRMYIN